MPLQRVSDSVPFNSRYQGNASGNSGRAAAQHVEISTISGEIRRENQNLIGKISTISGDVKLINCQMQSARDSTNMPLVSTVSGRIHVLKGEVHGAIKSIGGAINVDDGNVHGAITSIGGAINVDGGNVHGTIKSTGGNITINIAKAAAVSTTSGDLLIQHSTVSGDVVSHCSETVRIHESAILGKLTTSGTRLEIGSGAVVNQVRFDGVREYSGGLHMGAETVIRSSGGRTVISGGGLFIGSMSSSGSVSITGRGIYVNGQAVNVGGTSAQTVPVSPQTVVLRDGATLRGLEFESEQCALVLEGSAQYHGDHHAVGLSVERR